MSARLMRTAEAPASLPSPGPKLDFSRLPAFPPRPRAQPIISQPGDAYELEAERTAEQILRMQEVAPITEASAEPSIHRACDACVRKGSAPDDKKKPEHLLRQAVGVATAAPVSAAVLEPGAGEPLPPAERVFFEPRFGFDFSSVRIHTDARADAAARSISAIAYTLGSDIVFRSQAFQPGTPAGRRLLAHELTHVVQQGTGIRRLSRKHAAQIVSAPRHVQRMVDEDGQRAAPEEGAPVVPASVRRGQPRDLPPAEAEEIGRRMLRTLGYEALIERAMAAGLLRPRGAPEAAASAAPQVHRFVASPLIQRQAEAISWGAVFSRYAVAAGITSQLDSPAPGPADLVALGILAVGLVAATVAVTRTCPPCPSPPSSEIDRVPPSRPHFPCPGDHWHYYEYHQNPVTCQCFGPYRRFGGCCGMGVPGAPC